MSCDAHWNGVAAHATMKIQVLLYDGFDELDAIAPFEVFRIAEAKGADVYTELVTLPSDQKNVYAQRGLIIRCEKHISIESPPDLLVVPGGGWGTRAKKGAWSEYQKGNIPHLINQMYKNGVIIASVCTGAMLLAKTGLLNGKKATTHHNALEDLRKTGAEIVNTRVVDEGDLITSGGITSGIDLALWVIERFFTKAISESVEKQLEYTRVHNIWQKK